ncbi:MAG: ANTAR domain-containing protein [Eubacteriales bacterium]
MSRRREPFRVLVISKSIKMAELLIETLPHDQFTPIASVSTVGESKRMLVDNDFDIIVINTPLEDDFGIQTALDIVAEKSASVMILVAGEIFDQVTYKVEDHGIVTLAKPTSKQAIYSAIKMISAMRFKVRAMERETLDLRSKMEEIRIITRAKWILVDQLHMDEPQAHHYIEKQAMDRCVKKIEIAKNIIRTYER